MLWRCVIASVRGILMLGTLCTAPFNTCPMLVYRFREITAVRRRSLKGTSIFCKRHVRTTCWSSAELPNQCTGQRRKGSRAGHRHRRRVDVSRTLCTTSKVQIREWFMVLHQTRRNSWRNSRTSRTICQNFLKFSFRKLSGCAMRDVSTTCVCVCRCVCCECVKLSMLNSKSYKMLIHVHLICIKYARGGNIISSAVDSNKTMTLWASVTCSQCKS